MEHSPARPGKSRVLAVAGKSVRVASVVLHAVTYGFVGVVVSVVYVLWCDFGEQFVLLLEFLYLVIKSFIPFADAARFEVRSADHFS